VGGSGSGPHSYHSGRHYGGCSEGRSLFYAPPVCACGCSGCHASRLLPRRSCTGAEVAFPPSCAGWWIDAALPRSSASLSCYEGARGQIRHCCVVLMAHVGWQCVVETPSSSPTAPPHARAACGSRAALGVPRALRAPGALRAKPPLQLCSGSPERSGESIVVLNNSPVRVARMRMHLIMVLCDLVLEHLTLLF
jgi:hypothetical protein